MKKTEARAEFAQQYQHHRESFDRDGLVLVRDFLPEDEIRALQREISFFKESIAPSLTDGSVVYAGPGRPDVIRVLDNLPIHPFFDELGRSPRWLGMAEALLGCEVTHASADEYSPFGWQAFFDHPPGQRSYAPPHQDNNYYRFQPNKMVAIWVAIDSASAENGGMRYLPGSHRLGFRPHEPGKEVAGFSMVISDYGEADREKEMVFSLKPGDAVIHHGDTVHRTSANHSNRFRGGFSMTIRAAACERDEEWFASYMRKLEEHNRNFALIE